LRKLTNRRRCLSCLPFGARRKGPKGVLRKAAAKKQRDWLAKRQQDLGEPHHRHLRRTRKEALVGFFGGGCQFCGYSRCFSNLEFHHVSGDKLHTVSGRELQYSLHRVAAEVQKCILVCSNCHGEVHAGLVSAKTVVKAHHFLETKVAELDGLSWSSFLGRPPRKERPPCKVCGAPCSTPRGVYCSLPCKAQDERRVERPTRGALACLISRLSWVEIGRRFRVSDNTVRKWARGYGL